jgi:hypothetical protein
MGQMIRHLPAACSYARVTILIQELPGGGTQVAYDTVASAIAPYGDAAASQVAGRLDTEVLPPAPRDRHTGHGSTPVTQRLSAVADGPERRARDHEHIVLIGRLPAEW